MQIINYEETPTDKFTHAVFDLYHPSSQRTDFNLEVCRSKAGNFYVKFPDIRNRRANAQKAYIRASSYSSEKEKGFSKSVLELLKPFLPIEALSQNPVEDMPF